MCKVIFFSAIIFWLTEFYKIIIINVIEYKKAMMKRVVCLRKF